MTKLEAFRQANPDLTILEASDPDFAQYGVKYDYPLDEIEQVMAQVEMPAKGSSYLQKIPALEKTETIQRIGRDVFAGMPVDAGATIGHTDDFSAFEYHQCSELNIMLDDVLMVLAKRQTLDQRGKIDPQKDGQLFYVPKGSIVELYNTTLHYAPIQITKAGYKVIVVVLHGTNLPLPDGFKSDNPRVVKQGKFQVVHPSRKDKIAQGYQVALTGDLLTTRPLDR
ncbi:DUF4867 family protein [Lactobacillus sp.]|uniref:DUF4867 family protein n=1 Tax=Lactobacillus sp. TaxID=1591 RepID=UPI003F02BDAE